MKISKEGYPVESTASANLSYSSNFASHSIFNIISASLQPGATSITFTHGLNYVPKVWIFMVGSDGDGIYYRRIPYLDDVNYKVDYYITNTTVVIESNGTFGSRLDFKIIVFTRGLNV
jgi:hypothetical protein